METAAKSTPLQANQRSLGAKFTVFGEWNMPLQYKGILEEHRHTRSSVSVFDTCHMGKFVLEGSTVQTDLSRLISRSVEQMEVGQCRYGLLLNEKGGILDDLVVYRQDQRSYMLVVNAGTTERDAEWIRSHVSPGTTFTDRSDQIGKVDMQGPESFQVLSGLTDISLDRMQYYRFGHGRLWEFDVLISRTGYTGELGYEIYTNAQVIGTIWSRFVEHPLVEPAGLGARDTLRLEMGYPLYGQDMDEHRSPFEAGLEQHLDMTKEFIGKQALIRKQKEGVSEKLVGMVLNGRQAARHGFEIQRHEDKLGIITSGSFGPSLGRAIALGYVASPYAKPGICVEIAARSHILQAQIAETPFYKKGTVRVAPRRIPSTSRFGNKRDPTSI